MVNNPPDVGGEENPPVVYVDATVISPAPTANEQQYQSQAQWTCPQCTLSNPARKLYCIACFHRHPDLTPADLHLRGDYHADDDEDNYGEEQIQHFSKFDVTMIPDQGDQLQSTGNILEAQAEEDPFHKKTRRRERRRRRMIAGGAAGVAVGAVLGGSAMVVAGMVSGVVGTRVMSKQRERLKDERLANQRYRMATQRQTKS